MTLTAANLAQVTALLEARYGALVAQVRAEVEQSEHDTSVDLFGRDPADEGDRSVADLIAELNVIRIDRHTEEMRDIEFARARLRDGTFGRCVDCGESMESKRLLACPTAKRCAACQRRRERIYVHAVAPTL